MRTFGLCCLLLAHIIILSGCAAFSTKDAAGHLPPDSSQCDIPGIIASIQSRQDSLKTLKASARVNIRLNDRDMSGRAIVLVKRPDMFRVEITGPLNQTAAVVIYSQSRLYLLSLQENRVYKDYTVSMDVSRLAAYLSGLPYSASEKKTGELNETGSLPEHEHPCHIRAGDENVHADINGDIKEIRYIDMKDGKGRPVRVVMDLYKDIGGLRMPFAISVAGETESVSIRYDNASVNYQLSDDLFQPPQVEEADITLPEYD